MTAPKMFYFDGESVSPTNLSTAKRRYKYTDAGFQDAFVVVADNAEAALEGATRWIKVRNDDNEKTVPDDLALVEEHYTVWKTFMTLVVS